MVAPYERPSDARAAVQVVCTWVPLAAVFWLMHRALAASAWMSLALAVPAAGLLVRTFIVMHDCGHGSFFSSCRLNGIVGWIAGVLTLTPYAQWRRDHALHHASSGDLDRRGHGDVKTLTVREFNALTPRGRLAYRLLRHPAVLFGIGPLHLMLTQRVRPRGTPLVLRWFTGDIGVHHVHHLSPRIPNYRLQRCHDENPIFHGVTTLRPRDTWRTLSLALWDEECGRLVSFAQEAERRR